MKILYFLLTVLTALFSDFSYAQVYVDTGKCKVKIPAGYSLILEANSSEKVVFEKVSDLSTIKFSINKNYFKKNAGKTAHLTERETSTIIAKNDKYAVVMRTRKVKEKQLEFYEVFFDGLMIGILGSDGKYWSEMVEDCK